MAFAKFEGNRFRIDGEIAENHAILVNLTARIYYIFFVTFLCHIQPHGLKEHFYG